MLNTEEQQIIKNFSTILPKLSSSDKSYLLGLGEGMAIKICNSKEDSCSTKNLQEQN